MGSNTFVGNIVCSALPLIAVIVIAAHRLVLVKPVVKWIVVRVGITCPGVEQLPQEA